MCTAWVDARRRERLDYKPFLMPGLSEVRGTWLDRRMTSAEGSVWLKEFMRKPEFHNRKLPSTHHTP